MSGYKIQQALSIWHAARERIADESDDHGYAQATDDVHALIAELLRDVVSAEDMSAQAKTRAAVMRGRATRFDIKAERLRGVIMSMMDILDQKTLKLPDLTATIREGKPRVVITDLDALPAEYVKIERTPIKTEIAVDIKLGVVIPGAEMSNSMPSLQIRTT